MAFPIIPKKRSGATGNPSSLTVGELAVNTATGELFLGGDSAVMLLNPPTSAGTTVTEHTGDGTTVAFTFTGYNGTADGGYLVSVGGVDQPPSKYSVSSVAGGTLTFVEAPVSGELISIRAIVAGTSGGGGSGIGGRAWSSTETYAEGDLVATAQRETWICIQGANTDHDPTTSPLWWQPMPADAVSLQGAAVSVTAPTTGQGLVYNGTSWAPAAPAANATQIQSRDVATTAPTAGQFLAWNASTSKWEPQGGGGSVTFDTVGTHLWSVPPTVRYALVSATAGDGSAGTNGTAGANGVTGNNGYYDYDLQEWVLPTTGANGADGVDGVDGAVGKSLTLAAVSVSLAGGAAGSKGLKGFGGGGSGGGGAVGQSGLDGSAGSGPTPGGAGLATGIGGAAGGGTATAGGDQNSGSGGSGGLGSDANGGAGGNAGSNDSNAIGGGGGGGGLGRSGGGGGAGGTFHGSAPAMAGAPGAGANGSFGTAGGAGQTFTGAANFSAYAGGQVSIVISEGEGNASITITY